MKKTVCQIGIVVRDIEVASAAWAALLGVPVPSHIVTEGQDKTHMKYRGAPSEARAKLAFFKVGQLQIELIEPIGEPSIWRDFADNHGQGVQHVAFDVESIDKELATLESRGQGLIQKGEFDTGRYAYIESAEDLGVDLELLEMKP